MSDLLLFTEDRPVPVARPPLPPFPAGAYVRDLPWTPPQSREFLRADAWGVTISGLPWVPGASSRHPERCLTWFLDRWSADWQARILTAHAERGYTHFILSAADSMGPVDNGPNSPPGAGRSLGQFVETCQLVKAWGFYPVVFLGSKYFQPHDMDVASWCRYALPILGAIAGTVDEVVPGWEWNLWNVPGQTSIDVIRTIGEYAHRAGLSCWLHYSPHVTSWQANGSDRFSFWAALGDDVDGLMYQTQPEWDVAELQARIVDTLWWFGVSGNRWKFRLYEDQAIRMFDGDTPTEDDSNLRSYLACCTVDNVRGTDAKVWGYGQGGRRPEGSLL